GTTRRRVRIACSGRERTCACLGRSIYGLDAYATNLRETLMEKIMSKSNDTSKITALEDHRPLADSELDAVTGGLAVTDPTTILAFLLSGLFTQGSTTGSPQGCRLTA